MKKFNVTLLSLASVFILSGSPASAIGACTGAAAKNGTAHHCIPPCRDFKGECQCPD